MQRIVAIATLAALTACALSTHSHPQPVLVRSEKTIRRCVRHIDLSSGGARSAIGVTGVHGTYNEFGAANLFSDEWMSAAWVVKDRALQGELTNHTSAEMVIDATILGDTKAQATNLALRLAPHSQQRVRLAAIADLPRLANESGATPPAAGTNAVSLKLGVRFADEECSYTFRLARAPSN